MIIICDKVKMPVSCNEAETGQTEEGRERDSYAAT
jgi:hypothetical protein